MTLALLPLAFGLAVAGSVMQSLPAGPLPGLGESVARTAQPSIPEEPVIVAGGGGPRSGAKFGVRRPAQDEDELALSRTRPNLVADHFFDPPSAVSAGATDTAPGGLGPVAVAGGPGGRLSMSAFGIDRPIEEFPCDRAAPPDDHVYRWGCAGSNNLYLMGHAANVFKPLHDAYLAGRLKVGMEAVWADAAGQVQTFHVTAWRLVRPDDANWAIADQPTPSMTLQTCVGADSEYRLLIRLVA